MGIALALLAAVLYLAFIVDWPVLLDAAGSGGWVYLGTFAVLVVLLVIIVSTPETAPVAQAVQEMHH